MVRPARYRYGQNSSFKQPLEASTWQELSAPVQSRSQAESNSNVTTFPTYAPKRKRTVDNSADSSSGLAFELEKCNESAPGEGREHLTNHDLDGTNEMDDFLRKNIRSENRRVKRINERNSHKVFKSCITQKCYICVIKADYYFSRLFVVSLSLDFNFLFELIFLIFLQMCFNCRQTGHEVADCPEVRKDVDHGAGICFKCGSTEHRLERCRVRTPNGKALFVYPYNSFYIKVIFYSCSEGQRNKMLLLVTE